MTVLLFDLGGVLVDSTGLAALKRLLPHWREADIATRWHGSAAVGRFERGVVDTERFAREFLAEWPIEMAPDAFIAAFTAWVTGFYPGALELLARLRRRHTLACLSNTNAAHWAHMGRDLDVFHHRIASHLVGHMKPEPEIYARALEQLGVAAGEVHFFDDLPANVAAAREAGMQAHQVRGVAETAAALRRLGLAGED
ncbi:MAG: HAD family phosphatase [Burkholderiaceae bacterium]